MLGSSSPILLIIGDEKAGSRESIGALVLLRDISKDALLEALAEPSCSATVVDRSCGASSMISAVVLVVIPGVVVSHPEETGVSAPGLRCHSRFRGVTSLEDCSFASRLCAAA